MTDVFSYVWFMMLFIVCFSLKKNSKAKFVVRCKHKGYFIDIPDI